MNVLRSHANPGSDEFRANRAANAALIADLNAQLERVAPGGGERARERHVGRGKLLPRERVDRLLDPGAPFLELLAAGRPRALRRRGAGRGDHHRASVASSGRECVIVANDATVKGGTYYPMTVKKHLRAQEIALQNRLPCIYLVDSGGAFLPSPGRGLPRPRALRPDLLQPGDDVGPGHPPDRRGDGLVHGGRRLRPGDERRDGDRAQPGHDLPRRAAAGEGGHRRGGHRRGTRRRRAALAHLGRHRPSRRRRRATRCRSSATSSRRSRRAPRCRGSGPRSRRRRSIPSSCSASSRPICASPTTRARSSPASSTARAFTSSRSSTARRWSPASPTSTATRSGSSPTTASSSPRAR